MKNFDWLIVQYGWTMCGLLLCAIFCVLGLVFWIGKEKACILISGYNSKTKQERSEYDEARLSQDERDFFLICALIFLAGAIFSIWFGAISFWIAFAIWLVYFFKNVHFDEEKAFGKYKK